MANLKQWILDESGKEKILGVVIGEMGWGSFNDQKVPNYAKQPKGKVLTWKKATPWLDYEFSSGYGAPECNAVYAWTKTKVIAIGQYDGATWAYSLPRNPTDIMPNMEGG